MLPVIGHHALREKLGQAVARGSLPASLLLYGPAGTGKERLALWLGTRLLCESPGSGGEPCGSCRHCTYATRGAHPDLHWYFPRPKSKDPDPDTDAVLEDYAGAIAERAEATGAWEQPDATDSLYVSTVRAIVRRASLTPAIASRKVIVVADADRMVPQEGSEQAANAFLKLLEEPSPNTTIILTTSAPGALLPTIRSRVVSVRVPPLTGDDEQRREALHASTRGDHAASVRSARAILDAARGGDADRYRTAFAQSVAGARGAYSATLDALTRLLHAEARDAATRGDEHAAEAAARGVACVEDTRRLARQNINPQLLTARLLNDLAPLLA